MLLAGAWVPRRARMEIRNPENGAFIGSVPRANAADVELALDSAFEARGDARAMPVHMRASILSKAATLLEKDSESFARTIAAEGIKTIREARQEVVRAAMTLRLAGEEAGRLVGETISFSQRPGSERRSGYFVYEPVGVVVAITPFNDPLNLVAHKVGPAIAAGNAVILKPHGKTPFSAIRLAQVLQRAGLPDNVLQVITGSGAEIGDQLVSDRRVRMVSFTGGRSTGERIASVAGVKKLSLELGSNCPNIVMADADIKRAANDCVSGAFWAAGQNCLHVQRIYVERPAYDRFREEMAARARCYITGPKLSDSTDMGCIIDEKEAARIELSVRSAIGQGGRIVVGGTREGTVMQPTLMENVPDGHVLMRDEVYGPVSLLASFDNFEEAVARANAVDLGLQAAIFTSRLETALDAIERLEAGAIMVNESTDYRLDSMPFGGIKGSGMGREGVRYAMIEMSEQKVACFNRTAR